MVHAKITFYLLQDGRKIEKEDAFMDSMNLVR